MASFSKTPIFSPTSSTVSFASARASPTPFQRWRQPSMANTSVAKRTDSFVTSAGTTAAECAAIACCCPLGLADLIFSVVYRLPSGLVRRAVRRRRNRRRLAYTSKKGWPKMGLSNICDEEDEDLIAYRGELLARVESGTWHTANSSWSMEEVELDKEMTARFSSASAGFWRKE